MAKYLISTPEPITSPALNSKWLATESANNFRLQRRDFTVTASSENTGSPSGKLIVTISAYSGSVGNSILVHDIYSDSMHSGTVTDIDGSDIMTDIDWISTMDIDYLNDNTLHAGYYFEGRLTINDALESLTAIAYPDTLGFADVDVSGILQTKIKIGKNGDNSSMIQSESNKSGKFTFEYRECWYGSDEAYTAEGNTWFYMQYIRSEEQGSNLYEFVTTPDRDALFANLFSRPVYFRGMPFDISFILPDGIDNSAVVTINIYDTSNNLLSSGEATIDITNITGKLASLTLDFVSGSLPQNASYITLKVECESL